MGDPVEKLARVLGSLQDMNERLPTLDNAALAAQLSALHDAYTDMQAAIGVQARDLQALRDQVRRLVDDLDELEAD